ncbi:MAG: sigma 54-interacting transcriptional regulator [candidate division KSB1 bacterium]|nr:sigma 54-interacting transcriptional regulator [candidate division KSB1 bacterium]MDQ7063218.1 sigma 54-interacting transcriptional regulator [candidate division KSB1 bacterium]
MIGAGRAGRMLLRVFERHPSIQVLGVVDKNLRAPGIPLAKKMNIPVAREYQPLLRELDLDLIVNVTGDESLQRRLIHEKAEQTELIGGKSAMMIWQLLDEYKKKEILEDRFQIMQREMARYEPEEFIIGSTPKMQEIASLIRRVAPAPTTVLIRGESGTGKEGVARMIHKNSPWRDRPLITVNCTAFSPTLIESELFGYKKGAFTGAVSDRIGLLELANDGILFLDEIGDMPLEIQSKLLRFLQSGEIRAIGDNDTKKIKVRIIAATNRKLEEAIEKGEFRADLFYRLNTFTIHLPPLRERLEDIPLLAYHFLKLAQAKVNKRVERISPEAIEAMKNYHWPGNLRELENVIERALVLTSMDEIRVEHLPMGLQNVSGNSRLDSSALLKGLSDLKHRMISQIERDALVRYLQQCHGNVSRAARAARVSRRTFYRLMEKHGINVAEFKALADVD